MVMSHQRNLKNDSNNFATVTANTGNMIISNQPITSKIDPAMVGINNQTQKQTNRMNNKSNCFSEHKNTVANVQSKTHSQTSKYGQQNHHTLQCISDINEFKQKINMVLQTQAFPNKAGPNQIENIQQKQMAINASASMNPSSRIGYQNPKHESPTPNLNKNQFFQKRKVNKQNGQNFGQDVNDLKNEQIINSAFQSFKHNLKQQQQQFIMSTNAQTSQLPAGTLMEQHHAQVHESKSQSNQMHDSLKIAQGGATYLLRSQKDKQRNQFQLQYQNAQTTPFQTNGGDMPNFNNDMQLHQKMLNGQYQFSNAKHGSKNMPEFIQQVPSTQLQQTNSQRRKLLIEYGNEQVTPDNVQAAANKLQKLQQSPEAVSSGNSRHNRSSVFSQSDHTKKQDLFETFSKFNQRLNIDILDDKDRENLKHFSMLYLADLKKYLELNSKQVHNNDVSDFEATQSPIKKEIDSSPVNHSVQVDSLHKVNPKSNQLSGIKSELQDDSTEKFKQNEKNLKEERLKRESKIDISLTMENCKVVKPNSRARDGNGESSAEKVNHLSQEPASATEALNPATIMRRNISQQQFTSDKQMSESDGNILFQTENNKTKKLQDEANLSEEERKIRFLTQLVEDLEKPKLTLTISSKTNNIGARLNQSMHYAHTSNHDKIHLDVYGMLNDNTQLKKDQSQTLEWLQGITPIKLFLASLNCQKPTPQQINVMNNSKQRLDLFKILQAREHVKFTNIQSEKMLQLHQKLEDEMESRNKAQNDIKSSDSSKFNDYNSKTGQANQKNSEIVNQYQQKQIQSMHNLQQLKSLRKQQQNDQKAFSIFQMNELAQFRSMSDGQQKQILLNNLQQGKFDEFESLLDPIGFGGGVKSNGNQQSASTTDATSNQNSSKLSKVGGKSMEHTAIKNEEMANSKTNADSAQRRSMMMSGQEMASSKENIGQQPGSVRMMKYNKNGNNPSEQATQRPPNSEFNPDGLHVIRKQELDQIIRNYEASEGKFKSIIKEFTLKQQKIKIFYQQMNEAFVNYIHNNKFYQQVQNAGAGLENLLPYLPKGAIPHATNDFDEKTRARIKARQAIAANNNSNSQKPIDRSKSKQTFGGKELEKEKDKKKDLNINQIEPVSASVDIKEANATAEPKKEGEGGEGEEPVQEVKKPRYFPPKKLPNPFENAAQEQEKFLQARKEALAKYSQISKNRFKQDENAPLKYVIRPGNNSKLIQRVFEKSGRIDVKYDNEGNISFPGWETADDYYDSLYNFKWKPTSNGIKYDLISKHGLKQLVNHVKGHYALTTKDNLFLNLKSYYESQKINIYDHLPLTIVLDYLKDDVGDRVETFFNILKLVDKHIDCDIEVINAKMQEMQIQREKTVKSHYKFSRCMHDRQNLWLLKPTGFNRGIGIHIFQNFDQLKDIMCNYYGIGRGVKDKVSIFQTHKQNHVVREYVDQNGEKQTRNFSFVIQKLIERPLLYLQRKFDIRTWVLLNSADGKVYVFKESYVRTSSKEYKEYDKNLANEDQIFMQLTNNAVQKVGEDYGKFEEGNIISLDTLFNFVSQSEFGQSKSKQELKNKFLEDAHRYIIDSMKSIKGKITMQKYTFELFGYDFIIDEDLNTYLIETNTNPCLEESNSLLRNMLPRMIDDLMNITMDPLFFPSETNKYKSAFPLPGNVFFDQNPEQSKVVDNDPHPGFKDNENLFKHVYTLDQ